MLLHLYIQHHPASALFSADPPPLRPPPTFGGSRLRPWTAWFVDVQRRVIGVSLFLYSYPSALSKREVWSWRGGSKRRRRRLMTGMGERGGGGWLGRGGSQSVAHFSAFRLHTHFPLLAASHIQVSSLLRRRCHLRSSHSRASLSLPTSTQDDRRAARLKTHLAISVLVSQQLAFVVFGSPKERLEL